MDIADEDMRLWSHRGIIAMSSFWRSLRATEKNLHPVSASAADRSYGKEFGRAGMGLSDW